MKFFEKLSINKIIGLYIGTATLLILSTILTAMHPSALTIVASGIIAVFLMYIQDLYMFRKEAS